MTRVPMRGVFGLLLLMAGACTRAADRTTDRPRDHVRIAVMPLLSNGPLYLARDAGDFAAEGIDAELVELSGAEGRLAAVLSGQVDAIAGALELSQIAAVGAGATLRAVADKGYLTREGCVYTGVVIRRGIDSLHAVDAIRRVATRRDGPSGFILDRLIRAAGGDPQRLEYVALPTAAIPKALASGAVDAATGVDPNLARLQASGTLWRHFADVAPGFPLAMLHFGPRLLVDDRALGVRVMRAYRRGVARYDAGKKAENVRTLVRALRLDSTEVSSGCWPPIRRDGRINVAGLADYQQWAHDAGLLRTIVPATQLWDSTFLMATDSIARDGRDN